MFHGIFLSMYQKILAAQKNLLLESLSEAPNPPQMALPSPSAAWGAGMQKKTLSDNRQWFVALPKNVLFFSSVRTFCGVVVFRPFPEQALHSGQMTPLCSPTILLL